MAEQTVIGKVGLTPKGEYNSETVYDILDVVSNDGNSYVSRIVENAQPLTNSDAWMLSAKKGETFTFEDLTESDIEILQGPALLAADNANEAANNANEAFEKISEVSVVLSARSEKIGINLPIPKAIIDVNTKSPGAMTLPAKEGNSDNSFFRAGYFDLSWDGVQLDMGIQNSSYNEYPAWIQARNPTDFSVSRPLWLNPNGGDVKIGDYIWLKNKQISVGRSPLGIMATFEGDITNGNNLDGVIITTNTEITESGYHDLFGLSSQTTKQVIKPGLTDTGLRVAITGDAYSNNIGFEGTLFHQAGIRGRAGFAPEGGTNTAVVKEAIGGWFLIRNETAGATIERAYGVLIENDEFVGNIQKRFGLYQKGSQAANVLEGNLGIGEENPSAILDIKVSNNLPAIKIKSEGGDFSVIEISSDQYRAALTSYKRNEDELWCVGLLYNDGDPNGKFAISRTPSLSDSVMIFDLDGNVGVRGGFRFGNNEAEASALLSGCTRYRESEGYGYLDCCMLVNGNYEWVVIKSGNPVV